MDDHRVRELLRVCYEEASLSPDTSTQIGAIIVSRLEAPWPGTLSHNGPPTDWVLQSEDLKRPRKYQIFEHAERRAIYSAARMGWPLNFCTMVSTWAACTDCARAVAECGIIKLVRHVPPHDDAVNRWFESVALGDEIMKKAGVEILNVFGAIPRSPKVLRGGEWFDPTVQKEA